MKSKLGGINTESELHINASALNGNSLTQFCGYTNFCLTVQAELTLKLEYCKRIMPSSIILPSSLHFRRKSKKQNICEFLKIKKIKI